MEKRSFDTHLTAHADPAHGELEPRSHDDVGLAATEAQISPLDAVGGEGVAGTQIVAGGRHRSAFRMMLEFFIDGFAQCGASTYPAGYFNHNAQERGVEDPPADAALSYNDIIARASRVASTRYSRSRACRPAGRRHRHRRRGPG